MTALQATFMNRRQLLKAASTGFPLMGGASAAFGQANRGAAEKNAVVVQMIDTSPSQQDVSKDFLTGSRAAFQDFNAQGGIKGKKIQHLVLETDGTTASLETALSSLADNPACVALFGTAGNSLATQLTATAKKKELLLPHIAPWLQSSNLAMDSMTFPVFAGRQEQIAFAFKSLSVVGMTEVGVVYGSAADFSAYRAETETIAKGLNLKAVSYSASSGLGDLGRQLTAQSPAVLLFIGGTPELAEFTLGLSKQIRQRYIVALADVNLQTLLQMGIARQTPIIATQSVPLVNTSSVLVRNYREILSRYFDEPPSPLSLAGFIAARCTQQILNSVDGVLTRSTVMTACQKTFRMDLGGHEVSLNAKGSRYVTQSMLTVEGRLIG